jgi:hypothetical protein
MKNIQFKLSNNTDKKIEISIEPEGSVIELLPQKFLSIEPLDKDNLVLEIQINTENDNLYLSFWPEIGTYKIVKEKN